MRTDGIQEVLLKNPTLINNKDVITKMRKAIKAVSRSTCSVFQKRVHHYKHFFPSQLSQWRSWPNANPLASVYVKFMGQEIAFANIDQSLVEQAIQVSFKDEFLSFVRQNHDD